MAILLKLHVIKARFRHIFLFLILLFYNPSPWFNKTGHLDQVADTATLTTETASPANSALESHINPYSWV